MASKGFYPVSTINPNHELKKAHAPRACWGAEVKIREFWLPVSAPLCTGSIHRGDYYIVHSDRRDHDHRVTSCLQCVIYFEISELEGEVAQFIPATPEQLEATRMGLHDLLDELNNMAESAGR